MVILFCVPLKQATVVEVVEMAVGAPRTWLQSLVVRLWGGSSVHTGETAGDPGLGRSGNYRSFWLIGRRVQNGASEL